MTRRAPTRNVVLVDTDVVSYYIKRDTRASAYEKHLREVTPAISFMTLAELERWAVQSTFGRPRLARMHRYLQRYALLPFDRRLCREWAEIMVECRRKGRPIKESDCWIAATARAFRLPLITHNSRHFEQVDRLVIRTEESGS